MPTAQSCTATFLSLVAPCSRSGQTVTLFPQVDDDWKVGSRKKASCSLAQWVANRNAALSSLGRWQLEVEGLPSMQELMAWNEDGICETPTGHRVEPDGTGPDGVPSWLRALRLI